MNCLAFPNMFDIGTSNINYDYEATKECLYLLIHSESGELFGDPEFGVKLKRYYFNQNNYILRDILIDELYSKIILFCPQIRLNRNNVTIVSSGSKLIARIDCRNDKDFIANTFELVLFKGEEF